MLKKVVILARHGQRAPFANFPTLQWKMSPLTNLSEIGKENAILKGKFLRFIYSSFCNNPTQIQAHSSNFHRTIETSYYILSEYLGIRADPYIYSHIDFLKKHQWVQRDIAYDTVFRGVTIQVSPNGSNIIQKIRAREHSSMACLYKDMIASTKQNHNIDLSNISGPQMFRFFDHLRCLRDNKLSLPFKEDYKILSLNESYGCRLYKMKLCDKTMRKLCNHYLFKAIIDFFMGSNKKMLLLGLHDYNIVSMLVSLGYIPDADPFYLSTIRIEMNENNHLTVYFDCKGKTQIIPVNSQVTMERDAFINELKREMFTTNREFIEESGNPIFKSNPKMMNTECTFIQSDDM
jgi:hypothetical protein